MKFSSPPSSTFFLSSYFIVNTILILLYPILRLFTDVGRRDLRHIDSFGFTYENSIIYTGIAFMAIHFLRISSMRQFLLNCLTVGKIVITCLLFFAKFNFCFIYIGICILFWIILPYPKYREKNKFIRIQSEDQFDEIIYENEIADLKSKNNKKNGDLEDFDLQNFQYKHKYMHFIQFYADWMLSCSISKQLWYNYSNRYTTPRLKFLQVNVDKLPQLAKRYNINISGFTKQLPSIIILQDGDEVLRFPPIKQNNKVDRIVKLDYMILLKYFDLESRYLETRQVKAKDSDQTDKQKEI